jgi:hypothetical protein
VVPGSATITRPLCSVTASMPRPLRRFMRYTRPARRSGHRGRYALPVERPLSGRGALEEAQEPVPPGGRNSLPSPADDDVWPLELLDVLVLCQVVIAQASAKVADVPNAGGVLLNDWLRCTRERRLIESVRNHLADGMRDRPVLKHANDVQSKARLSS